ncbi:translocation/assembly module TamB domain-containing protein [Niabella insulamsoli]|uniref:translocation/assembly module TamB domain-containing protein n=1 Tax=Niabella insulamsoli TaxID=3144874 RepID=UPI0031FD7BB3
MNRVARKVLKIVLWVIASLIMLVIVAAVSLNIPAVQNFVKDKVVSYLKKKTNTEISLERIRISFPTGLRLDKCFIADQKKDTLLYAGKLAVQLDMIGLIRNRIAVNSIELEHVNANVYRITPDTVFNYQFLVDAFVAADKEPEKLPKDSTAPLQLQLDKILFDDIRIRFKDDVAGNDAGVSLGKLNARVDKFDLEQMHYVLNRLELTNTRLHYFQHKPLTELRDRADAAIDSTEQESGGRLPLIEVKNFAFGDVDLKYDDRLSDTRAFVFLKNFNFKDLLIDLTNGKYQTSSGELSNSVIDFAYRPTPSNEQAIEETADSAQASAFSLYLDKIVLSNNTVKYDNLSAPREKGVVDFNHLNIKNLGISGQGIAIDSAGIKASITGGKLADTSGFVLNDLRGNIVYDDKQIKVEDLFVKTPHTLIDNNTLVTYTSQEDLSNHPERVEMAINFQNSVLGLADAAYFVSSVPASYRSQRVNLNALVKGRLNDIDIQQFQLSGLRRTQVDITGNITGLPKIENSYFNVNINKLNTSKADLNALLPKGTLPSDIELPNQIAANGKFKGSMNKFATQLNLRTDMGAAKLTAAMGGSSKNPTYKARLDVNRFNVGRLLKRTDMGAVTLHMDVAGSGTSAKTANAAIKGSIVSANYNNYTYQNIQLDGKYAKQALQLQTTSTDSNANFDINIAANIAGKYPAVEGTIDLKRIDLERLNFSTSAFKIAGLTQLNFPTASPDYLNGEAFITSLQVATGGKVINIDTISVDASASDTANHLALQSDIIDATLNGKYQLTQIGQAFINQIAKYYQFAPPQKTDPQQLRLQVRVHDSKLLKEFVPALHTFSSSYLTGILDTERDSLIVNASFPHIVYDSFDVANTTLAINNRDSNQLAYALNIGSVKSPSIQLYNAAINGSAANNMLDVNVLLRDSKNQDKYVIAGNFKADNETYQFSLDPQKLLLNYDKWQVAQNNLIQYGKAGIYVRDFEISNSGQALAINSASTQPNAPIKVEFRNFMLETLTRYAEQDTALVGGTLNGTVDVKNLQASPQFEADLTVNKLRYQKDELGDLRILSDNYTADAFKVDVALSGLHDLRVNGYYYTTDKGSLDMAININRIDLKHIESLTGGQIREGTGVLSGQLTAKGPLTAPKILGNLGFKDAGMNVATLNSYFRLNNESISFVDEGIRFDNFTLRDSANQAITLNGLVKTTDYSNFGFDLRVRANNFRLLNSTAADNELFYGKVFITLNANIGGDMNQPEVTGTLRINKDTRFFFAIPDNNPGVVAQDGIVEFVDMDAPPNNGREAINVDSLTRSPLKGLNVSMDLQTEKEAEITVVVDPANGDALLVKGEAELNVTMDPSGKLSMTGRYLISDGSYNLSIGGLAKRKFTLQSGSYITWTGAPTEANINITAVYNINTSPIDLVADQIQGEDQSTQNTFRQKLPFIVYLKMTEQLLKPKIAFEITMPENEKNAFGGIVYTRLQQVNSNESELNKQVFALLALNRFVSDNPFQSLSGGTSPEMLARQSVSRLLTQQLNNLASDLINGVDLSFDLTSEDDYTSGSQETHTDLNVALSKRLLNDRLTITVGSDFTLEGKNRNNTSGSNIAGNVNIEYLLSRDGRYRLRAYRRNQSDVVLEGQIIETGLGFALVVDYNQFKEIFNSLKKRQRWEERRARREAQTEKENEE